MRPGVNGDIIIEFLERAKEFLRVIENVDANEEMCGVDIILLEEIVQSV